MEGEWEETALFQLESGRRSLEVAGVFFLCNCVRLLDK